MIDEERIRSAYEAIAAAAPAPERVRARIDARARAQRQRRTLLVGVGALGGAAAAAAVGVPLLGRSGDGADQVAGPSVGPSRGAPGSAAATRPAGPSASATAAGGSAVSLLYAPGWLPDQLVAQYREVTYDPDGRARGSRRTWMPPGTYYPENHDPAPGVTVAVGERFDAPSGETVTIGDTKGHLLDGDVAVVDWTAPNNGPTLRVTASGMPDPAGTALRVARSVAATADTMAVSMRLPAIPARYAGVLAVAVHPRPGGWLQSIAAMNTEGTTEAVVIASTGAAPAHTFAKVTRPGGVTLWVPDEQEPSANYTAAEADRALNGLIWSRPDLGWAGRR